MNIVSTVLNKLFNKPVDVKIKVLPHARTLPIPRYMSDGAVGFDLYAAIADQITIQPFETGLIPTGIMIELPRGYELQSELLRVELPASTRLSPLHRLYFGPLQPYEVKVYRCIYIPVVDCPTYRTSPNSFIQSQVLFFIATAMA